MPHSKSRLYRVSFHNQGQVYEIYAREVSHSSMLGFVEVGKPVFGEKSTVLVDTSEEKLKNEFAGVDRFYVPVHSIIRIDEVHKQGPARITAAPAGEGGSSKVTPIFTFDRKK